MSCGLNAYLTTNSKHATKEQKQQTLDIIRKAGQDGIVSHKVREITGLELKDHRTLMFYLSEHGAIKVVGKEYKRGTYYLKWGSMACQ